MKKNTRNFKVGIVLIFVSVTTLFVLFPFSFTFGQTNSSPLVSTRGSYYPLTGELLQGHTPTDYKATNIPNCPPEIAIFVHGWGPDESEAKERYDRTLMSLKSNNYSIPLISFSWDSNADWLISKQIAKDNGPKLAHFIVDYMNKCKNDDKESKVRLISHSLGARVILSSLESLHTNSIWNNNDHIITSVHLTGAAVDNEEVSNNGLDITFDPTNLGTVKTTAYGLAIEEEVMNFYNLYSTSDNFLEPKMLMQIYPSFELDLALGQSGYQTLPYPITFSLPGNYAELNVENEIPPICDADGDKNRDSPFSANELIGRGDNHLGYIGFRNATDNTKLIDDGAVNIVVDNWRNVNPEINQSLGATARCN